MEGFLRNWLTTALEKHQYQTAAFVGDKLLAITTNYTRALSLVTRSNLLQRSTAARYLAAHCHIKQDRHDDALAILGEKNPVHLAATTDSARRKLQHLSNGPSNKQHGKSRLPTRSERADRSEERDYENARNLKYEAGMCHLRGLCYAKQNAFDRAKECYKDAVRIDVQCFEAFDQLMKNSLMSPGEEWGFLDSLDFDSVPSLEGDAPAPQDAAEFLRNLYTMRLSKYTRPDEFGAAIETLSTHYRLEENPDVLLAKAEVLNTSLRYELALEITSKILDNDSYNFACLPLHIELLYKLKNHNHLFALAHDLADTHPSEPCSWLAVGAYYLATDRIPEARSYFSKASLMDPHFGPAWIGFAHTFAAEGEGDQAVAAYSTAARLFQGTHLPQLFLGMQAIALGHLTLAREYLTTAYTLCDRDPQLINEIGVVAYLEDDYESAARHFNLALTIADDNEAPPQYFASTRLNLAHALRRAGRFHESLEQFDECIRLGLRDVSVFASRGLVLMDLDQPFEAVVSLHDGLAISPQDPMATDLLGKALKLLENDGVLGTADEEIVDSGLRAKLAEARQARAGGRVASRRKAKGPSSRIEDDDEAMEFEDARS